ncbi:MAG: single-stranded DNA-binding protein [Pseudomonadota bacterium]
MSNGINKVILVGNLGKDPEIINTESGVKIVNFSIATKSTWEDKSKNKQEKTEWHNISVFGKLAEISEKYLHKGMQVYIEGSLQTAKWEGKHGENHYTTKIIANTMQFLGSKSDSSQSSPNSTPSPPPQEPDDDIPF